MNDKQYHVPHEKGHTTAESVVNLIVRYTHQFNC